MDQQTEKAAETFYQNRIVDRDELVAIKAYRSLRIFSLHNELLFVLYVSVLLVSGGIGILIYKNIDTIGHAILIALVLLSGACCFYFSVKRAPKFSTDEIFFDNPVFDYLVLLGTLLSGTFFGYLQFQYGPLGNDFALASVLTSIVGFAAAYRFDNRSALSVAITTLAAAVGITMTPKAVMELDVLGNLPMFYIGVVLAIIWIAWAEYSERIDLKKHFAPVFYGFAQHLLGICSIAGLVQDFWLIFLFIAAGATYYFYGKSHRSGSGAMLVFAIVYAYIGLNIALIRLLILSESEDLMRLCVYIAPVFYLGSIYFFIKNVRQFNKEHQ